MQSRHSLQTTIQGAQLLVLVIGIIAAMTTIGRRDAQIGRNIEDLRELRNITEDLLKTSISVQISDQYQNEQLARLLERVARLEG